MKGNIKLKVTPLNVRNLAVLVPSTLDLYLKNLSGEEILLVPRSISGSCDSRFPLCFLPTLFQGLLTLMLTLAHSHGAVTYL